MARVTVEDCVLRVPNRFELVAMAAQRARHISAGAPLTVERDNDKNPVVALREIADETVDMPSLEEAVITGLQKNLQMDEPEEEMDLLSTATVADGEAAAEANPEASQEDSALTPGDGVADPAMPGNVVFEDAEVTADD